MSTVKTTNLQHPSASDVGITLGADGSVVLPQGFTGGIGSNVVFAYSGDVTFSTSSATPVDITGAAATITLSSATSKVLLLFNSEYLGNTAADAVTVDTKRDATDLNFEEVTYPTAGNRHYAPGAIMIVDTPGSVGPHTYQMQLSAPTGGTAQSRASRLTVIEVAA